MFRDIYRVLSMLVIVPGALFLLGAWFPSPVPIPVPEARVFYGYLPPAHDAWELERIAQALYGPVPPLPAGSPVYGTLEQELASRGLADLPRISLNRVTAYNPVIRQTDLSPNISSCGRNLENQIALSRDLFFSNGVKHLCGAEVLLISLNPATGAVMDVRETVVWDTMNERYSKTADVLFPTTDESVAYDWGARRGVLVVLP